MDIDDKELGEIYEFAVQLGKDAGRLLMNGATSRFDNMGSGKQTFTEKDSSVDIVTKTDEGESGNPRFGKVELRALTFSPFYRCRRVHQDFYFPEISSS